MFRLDGRTAVVTGAGQGIGRGIATVLGAQGAAVAAWDLNADAVEETASLIREAGGKALAVVGDAADPAAIAASAARTREEFGAVTVLVNNAGITNASPFLETTEDLFDRTIRINLKGPFLVTQTFVPDMLTEGWGRIVNISSSSAQSGSPQMAHYTASKGGVIGLTKALAMEYAAAGITVNNVPPGAIDTPLMRRESDPDRVKNIIPVKRAGLPADIAHAVAYLVSEEAGYVTGQTLSVNGGRYLV